MPRHHPSHFYHFISNLKLHGSISGPITAVFAIWLFWFSHMGWAAENQAPEKLKYSILKTLDHADYSFTQGFYFEDGLMYESSGLFGKSFVRIYDPLSQKIQAQQKLPSKLFAEGLTRVGEELFMLTWKAQKALVLDAHTLKTKREFQYKGQGWGLTHDGQRFIMTNGLGQLSFRNTHNFALEQELPLTPSKYQSLRLNELEYAEGFVWANAWFDSNIYKIDPKSGQITAILDLSQIVNRHFQAKPGQQNVLNGIAYDAKQKAFWVTGKLWPKSYLIRIHSH